MDQNGPRLKRRRLIGSKDTILGKRRESDQEFIVEKHVEKEPV